MSTKTDFLYPRYPYYGDPQQQYAALDANLQDFAQRVGVIACLESNGKIGAPEAFEQIKALYKQLKQSKKNLADAIESLPQAENL
jgi:hypothetical protein